jgi:hypothetical protein
MTSNPLQGFFRKPKFAITLPSRGKWYPKKSLNSTDGTVEVFAMTAADDTRFKTNEVLISHTATYDLIRSCVPQIAEPENMPVVDLDAVILSIRRASYGNQMKFRVLVPNTTLERMLDLDIEQMVNSLANVGESWDEELNIQDGDLSMTLTITPLPLKNMFAVTRQLIKQQQIAENISKQDNDNEEKIDAMDQQLKTLSNIGVNTVVEGIRSIRCGDYFTDRPSDIRQFIQQIDLEYFNAIRKHIEGQKKLSQFATVNCVATPEEAAAGAPDSWQATVEFNLTNFFGE